MFHQNTDTNAVSFVNSEVVCFWLPGQERIRGQQVSGSEESWQRLHPVVECGDDAMTLTVRRRRAVQLLLNRGEATVFPFTNTDGDVIIRGLNMELHHTASMQWVSSVF